MNEQREMTQSREMTQQREMTPPHTTLVLTKWPVLELPAPQVAPPAKVVLESRQSVLIFQL